MIIRHFYCISTRNPNTLPKPLILKTLEVVEAVATRCIEIPRSGRVCPKEANFAEGFTELGMLVVMRDTETRQQDLGNV